MATAPKLQPREPRDDRPRRSPEEPEPDPQRLEHWPITYTLGIWLWIACFPALFLAGYRRLRASRRVGADLLSVFLAETPAADVERALLHGRLLAVLFVV